MKSRLQSNRGVTMVEALIALILLGFGALGLISTAIFSKGVQQEAVEINEASKIAQGVLESFRKIPYIALESSVPAGVYSLRPDADPGLLPLQNYNIVESGLLYQLQTRLVEWRLEDRITVENATDAVRVSIQVHRAGDTEGGLVGMTTYIVKNGINFR